jgi:dienelactone hydrolase
MKKLVLLLSTCFLLFAQSKSEGTFVTYTLGDKTFEGYYASPSKNAPLVFLVHDWDGITDYEVKRAKMLYDLGYAAFAVDLYGKGVRPTKLEDKKALTKSLYTDREVMRNRLYAGLSEAKRLGANMDNALGIGYCFGGAAILELARSGADLKAFIPFHGGLATPKGQSYANTKGQIIVFHGSADKAVSINDFAALATELEKYNITHEMTTYSGAPHAFTVFASKRYHKIADEKSWKRFVEILGEVLQ